MAQLVDYVQHLSQKIGPRPAGTEEEQQAAHYIAEQLENDAQLQVAVEDFTGNDGAIMTRSICCLLIAVLALLSFFFGFMVIPAAVLSVLAAAVYAAETFNKPLLSRFIEHSASQNVVAIYNPAMQSKGTSRRRKVVLLAHYDSGKVKPSPIQSVEKLSHSLPTAWICFGATLMVALLLLMKALFFSGITGGGALFYNLLIIVMIVLSLPLPLKWLLYRFAPYSDGANVNATGAGILMEVARRVGQGLVRENSSQGLGEGITIQGKEAAYAANLVPEGTQIVYDAAQLKTPEMAPQTSEERLAAAKAAIAALTGRPETTRSASDISQNLVHVSEIPPLESLDENETFESSSESHLSSGASEFGSTEVSAQTEMDNSAEKNDGLQNVAVEQTLSESEEQLSDQQASLGDKSECTTDETSQAEALQAKEMDDTKGTNTTEAEGLPDWFVQAQRKAKKPKETAQSAQRSRYADALDSAETALRASHNEDEKSESGKSQSEKSEENTLPFTAEPFAQNINNDASIASSNEKNSQSSQTEKSDEASSTDQIASANSTSSERETVHEKPSLEPLEVPSFLETWKAPSDQEDEKSNSPASFEKTDEHIYDTPRTHEDANQDDSTAQDTEKVSTESPVTLPTINLGTTGRAAPVSSTKQRAPLAASEEDGKSTARGLLTMLPSIKLEDDSKSDDQNDSSTTHPSRSGALRSLRANLPSLSGSITRQNSGKQNTSVSSVGSFVAAGATGAFAPVGDELLDNVDPDDIYVDDADDSDLDDNYTESGAFAGPGYVEMPKSRRGGFLSRFKRKKNRDADLDETPQEWLDVDESFNPREVGHERGGWESFREENQTYPLDENNSSIKDQAHDDFEDHSGSDSANNGRGGLRARGGSAPHDSGEQTESRWQGGAFSKKRARGSSGARDAARRNTHDYENVFDEDTSDFYDDQESFFDHGIYDNGSNTNDEQHDAHDASNFETQETSNFDAHDVSNFNAQETTSFEAQDKDLSEEELCQIHHFRNPSFNTEIWFVALGAEVDQHEGIRTFFNDHADELRGAIFIELEGLGAGSLSLAQEAGSFFPVKFSSRRKRYAQRAERSTGITCGSVNLRGSESASSFIARKGYITLHLVGAHENQIAFDGSADDVFEAIDLDMLEENADFVTEIVRNV